MRELICPPPRSRPGSSEIGLDMGQSPKVSATRIRSPLSPRHLWPLTMTGSRATELLPVHSLGGEVKSWPYTMVQVLHTPQRSPRRSISKL